MDVLKLLKLLMLTTSPNDNESLLAIRTANDILKKNNLSWKSFNLVPLPVRSRFRTPPPPDPKIDLDERLQMMFGFIYENAWDNFDTTFVDSLFEQWENRDLSEKQIAALEKVYKAVINYTRF